MIVMMVGLVGIFAYSYLSAKTPNAMVLLENSKLDKAQDQLAYFADNFNQTLTFIVANHEKKMQ